MTIFYPDVSDYQHGISLNGMDAVVAKATEGNSYTSPDYARVAAGARTKGIPFAGYHFLWPGNAAGQADYYFRVAGKTPCMIDCERGNGGSPTTADAMAFAKRLVALGGRVRLLYLSESYHAGLGKPDLRPFAAMGIAVANANYTTYSDTGVGWRAYGGVTPAVWQYTSSFPLNGFKVDMNAFRGTMEQFRALLEGGGGKMDETYRVAYNADKYGWKAMAMADAQVYDGSGKLVTVTNKQATVLADVQGKTANVLSVVQKVAEQVATLSTGPAVQVDAVAVANALAGNATFVDVVATAAANKVLAGMKDLLKAAVA